MDKLSTKNIFSKLEEPLPSSIKEDWKNIITKSANEIPVITDKANKAIPLADYLNSRYILQDVPSNSGWTYKTYCPFHKHGNERTASFFINPQLNRYYCQACGVSGGIVDFISRKFGRPYLSVAEFILNLIEGKIVVETEEIKKANEAKKFTEFMIKLSELYNSFIHSHIGDDDALEYIIKCMNGFDDFLQKSKESVQKSKEAVLNQINLQLSNYDQKKGKK